MIGAAALRRLEEFLAAHPGLTVEREEGSITVRARGPEGFDVQMTDEDFRATISTPDWRGHYQGAEEAAATFMWLLGPKTRFVRTFSGPLQLGWKLQWDEDGKWMTGERGVSPSAFLVWGKRRVEIVSNDLV